MRYLLLLLPLLALGLLCESCATTATPGAAAPTALQTFDALYSNAVAATDLVNVTATSALQSGLITAAQAQKVLSTTDSVKAALDAANAAAQPWVMPQQLTEILRCPGTHCHFIGVPHDQAADRRHLQYLHGQTRAAGGDVVDARGHCGDLRRPARRRPADCSRSTSRRRPVSRWRRPRSRRCSRSTGLIGRYSLR